MKNINKIILLFVSSIFLFASCETYDVKDPNTTSIAPLDGRYICLAYAATDASLTTPLEYFDVRITATTNNENNKMWMNIVDFVNYFPYAQCISVKVDCDPNALSFSGSNLVSVPYSGRIQNPRYSNSPVPTRNSTGGNKINIVSGTLVIDGWNTPTGYKSDSITFNYTIDGVAYKVVGNRYTGWDEDYSYITTFVNSK